MLKFLSAKTSPASVVKAVMISALRNNIKNTSAISILLNDIRIIFLLQSQSCLFYHIIIIKLCT